MNAKAIYGSIAGASTDVFEYDAQESIMIGYDNGTTRVNLSDFYISVAEGDTGTDYDGFIRTVKAWNTNGTIKKSVIDSYEYDNSDGECAGIKRIPGTNKYLIAYRDITGDRTTLKTVYVYENNGTIGKHVIDTKTLTYDGDYISFCQMTSNIWAIAYEEYGTGGGATYDGFMETVFVNASGTINDTSRDIEEFDTSYGYRPFLCKIDNDTVAIDYNSISSVGDFTVTTYNISSSGLITDTPTSSWNYEHSPKYYTRMNKIGSDKYMVTYLDTGSGINIKTFNISNNGVITTSFIDTLQILRVSVDCPNTFMVNNPITLINGVYGVVLSGKVAGENDGYVYTWNISNTGILGDSIIDSLEFNTTSVNQTYNSQVTYMGNNYYLFTYTDQSLDGYMNTVYIETNLGGIENDKPVNSNAIPVNGANNQILNPQLSISIIDQNGDTMNVTFKTNATGVWGVIGTNSSVNNGTYRWTNSSMLDYGKKYWWSVSTNDGMGGWDNDTYYFTTLLINTSVDIISPYSTSLLPLTVTASSFGALSNVTLYYRYSSDNVSWGENGLSWETSDNHYDGDGIFSNIEYVNKAVVMNANHYNGITPSNNIFGYTASYGDSCLTIINTTKQWQQTELTHYSILNKPHDIYVMDYPVYGRIAFILCYNDGKIHAVNVTDVSSISTLDSIDNSTGNGMYLDVDEINKLLYMTNNDIGTDYLIAYNISNPNNLKMIYKLALPDTQPWTPYINGDDSNYVYVGNQAPNGSIELVNATWIKNITSPKMVFMKIQGYGIYADIKQDGKYLYASSNIDYSDKKINWSLSVWDITNPTNLTNVSRTTLNTYNHFCLWNASGYDYAFTRHYTNPGYGDYGINIVDLANKSLPVNIGYIPDDGGGSTRDLYRCHWMQLHYNNITNSYVLYVIGYMDDSWVTFNITRNSSYVKWTSASNPDTLFPWSWNFDFPNGTGYYEFYSIGKKTGCANETAPSIKDAMCYFSLLNNPPVASNPIPLNASLNNNINPIFYITINDSDADLMNVTFRENSSGSWVTIASNLSVSNGTYSQYAFMMSSYNTKYNWSINLTDSVDWSNYTFFFTTKSNTFPIVSNEYPLNGSIGVSVWLHGVHAYFSDGNGDSMTWNITLRNETASNTDFNVTGFLNTSFKFSYNTLYYWYANATDGFNSTNNTFHFTTMTNVPPVISSPYPSNNSVISSTLTQLRVNIGDFESFNYTIELSNGLTTFGNNVTNGTKTLNILGGLNNGELYAWWVNTSDGMDTSTAKYFFSTTNATSSGSITVTFDINQFSLVILLLMTFFFIFVGMTLRDGKVAGIFLMFAGVLFFNLVWILLALFGGLWILLSPAYFIFDFMLFYYGCIRYGLIVGKGKGHK